MNRSLRKIYWAVLLNPIALFALAMVLKSIVLLAGFAYPWECLSAIIGYGTAALIWFIGWTFVYFVIRPELTRTSVSGSVVTIVMASELIALLGIVSFYCVKTVGTARQFGSRLYEISAALSAKKVRIEHDNIYTDGIDGIISDMDEELDLPETLYVDGSMEIDYKTNGKVTLILGKLYGVSDDDMVREYELEYGIKWMGLGYSRDDIMRVTVTQRDKNSFSFDEEHKFEPCEKLAEMVDIEAASKEFCGDEEYNLLGLVYAGDRSFESPTGAFAVDSNSGTVTKASVTGSISGYELSLYTPDNGNVEPFRYFLDPDMMSIEMVSRLEKTQFEAELSGNTGTVISDSNDGSMYYMIDERNGWKLEVADAACGSRFYRLLQTGDGGATWSVLNEDPFCGEIGTAEGISIISDKLGFAGIATASSDSSSIYRSADGGITFERVSFDKNVIKELPEEAVELGMKAEDYDYCYLPWKDGEKLIMRVGLDAGGEADVFLESNDDGLTWTQSTYSE